MKKNIDTYVSSIASDNAEYIISNADFSTAWNEYFDEKELDETGEPSAEQIDELKDYLKKYYNFLP